MSLGALRRGQQRRHDHDRAQRSGTPVRKFHSRQSSRTQQVRDHAIDQRNRQIRSRNRREHRHHNQVRQLQPQRLRVAQRNGQNNRSQNCDGAEISRDGVAHILAQQSAPPGNLETRFLFKFAAAVRNQVVAGIGAPRIAALAISVGFAQSALRALHRAFGDFNFAVLRTAGQIFDGVPVIIARGEIHLLEIAALRRAGPPG